MCACRDCARCQCFDRGRSISAAKRVTLSGDVCSVARANASQHRLGLYPRPVDCRRACEQRLECISWMHHAVSGECVGHDAYHLLDHGGEPEAVTVGVAQCAPASIAAGNAGPSPDVVGGIVPTRHTLPPPEPPARFLVLHATTTWAVSAAVAARLARAHLQMLEASMEARPGSPGAGLKAGLGSRHEEVGAGHLHRIALAGSVCPHHAASKQRRSARGHAHFTAHLLSHATEPTEQVGAARAAGNGSEVSGCATADGVSSERAWQHLRTALGALGVDAASVVDALDEASVDAAVPGLLARLERASWRWADRRRPRWLSNGCDLLGLIWYVLHAPRQPRFQWLWVVQHDVGFTGDLGAILRAAALPSDDLVCVDLTRVQTAAWAHYESRNARHRSVYAQISSCLLPVVRYGRRLLDALVADLRRDVLTYCEARAATTCAARGWCRIRDLRTASAGLLGAFSFYSLLNESFLGDADTLAAAPVDADGGGARPGGVTPQCDGGLGKLFHRVV